MPDEASLRRDARTLAEAALRAVEPTTLVEAFLRGHAEEIAPNARIRLLAIGKAAPGMAAGALRALGARIANGVIVAAEAVDLPGIEAHLGGHPIPNAAGVEGARAVARLADESGEHDLILCLLSGGASALASLPPEEVPLEDLCRLTEAMLRAGADIEALNCVRKPLDLLKGGRLARLAAPARVVGLVLSDVVGDRLDLIASGPLVPAGTGSQDAIAALHACGCWDEAPATIRACFERGGGGEPPADGDACFEEVSMHVVGSNHTAVDAVRKEARRLGYAVRYEATPLVGEAREEGARLGRTARSVREQSNPLVPPACILSGGETTVRVRGEGRGGRNQELALGAAVEMDGLADACLLSLATDGRDGPTDAAGALATGTTVSRALEAGLDPAAALARNDSHGLFEGLGDLVKTGPTGTNVADVQILLVG